ncbi:tyrosine-type recombinase/integrase [Dyella sp. A6]|uniref:tyrosine-type recombinase/integrase n=1 Tax=Dyella aluminiiresistens TaxID=3069105 RepID=UPI002E796C0A|nr:tyrosine-type recombinase/integrase [Dyella sp. A6]
MGADTPLSSITRRDIEAFITYMLDREQSAPATVNRHLACLRRMFNIALTDEWEDAPDHFPKIRQPKERGARQYFMSSTDEGAIFAQVLALDTVRLGPEGGIPRKRDAHRYYVLFTFLVETGLRLGEALGLQWVEVSRPEGGDPMLKLFRPEALKTGKPRSVPLTQKALESLQSCKGVKGGPFADLDARRAHDIWTRAKAAAGITRRDCVIHSLRHTCASRLLESGVDLKIVKEWLGHSVITTTDGYTHLATHQLTAAAVGLEKLRTRGT